MVKSIAILSTIILLSVTARHASRKGGAVRVHGHRNGKHQTAQINNQVTKMCPKSVKNDFDDTITKATVELGQALMFTFGLTTEQFECTQNANYTDIIQTLMSRLTNIRNVRGCDEALGGNEARFKELFEEVYKLFYNVRSTVTDNNIHPSTSFVRRATSVDMRSYEELLENNEQDAIQRLKLKCRIIEFFENSKKWLNSVLNSNNHWSSVAQILEKVVESEVMEATKGIDYNDLTATYKNLVVSLIQGEEIIKENGGQQVEKILRKNSMRVLAFHDAIRNLTEIDNGYCMRNLTNLFKELGGGKYNFNSEALTFDDIESFIEKDTETRDYSECYKQILIIYNRVFMKVCGDNPTTLDEKYHGLPKWVETTFHRIAAVLVRRIKMCDFRDKYLEWYHDLEDGMKSCSTWKKWSGKMGETDNDISSWWDTNTKGLCLTEF